MSSPLSPRISGATKPNRLIEWFWRGAALAEAERTPSVSERSSRLTQRAAFANDWANITLLSNPAEPDYEAIASELYRQSVFWSASARAASEQEAVWSGLDDASLEPVAEGLETREALRETLRRGSFGYFAELPPLELGRARVSLRALAQSLLLESAAQQNPLEALKKERATRVAALVLVVLAGLFVVRALYQAHLASSDLALGKPWHLSSNYGEGGCTSPEQECQGNSGYFFHTRLPENHPWIEFDLQTEQAISGVEIENRRDCCFERAVPLLVEVSADQKHWQLAARRDTVFSSWRAAFDTVHARYLRLRVDKVSALHLARVRIYP